MKPAYQLLGIRSSKTRSVGLFFAHNVLLGMGAMLVYVAANVLLLSHDPARSLPLAYGLGALAMLLAGRLYAHYEQHLLLRTLAGRALLLAGALTLLLGLLGQSGPSVGMAMAIMTGYRLLHLLTNLELRDMPSLVFNERQGRRLFGVISASELGGKALGAALAVVVHGQGALHLLLLAFGCYLLAWLAQQATFRTQHVAARPAQPRAAATAGVERAVPGNRPLRRLLGLSLMVITAVAVGVEYLFLVNVEHTWHEQTTMLQGVGGVLALTYLLAMGARLLLARRRLAWLGVRQALLALPLLALGGTLLVGGLQAVRVGPAWQLAYFCGMYLLLEAGRRVVFEPVFLLLFQPLAPAERLRSLTLAQGFYEPLGLGLGGLLLWALPYAPGLSGWAPFGWMAALLLLALWLLRRTYSQYLAALQRRLGLPSAGASETVHSPATDAAPAEVHEVLAAVVYLQHASSAMLLAHADELLRHPSRHVRARVLALVGLRLNGQQLCRLALCENDQGLREQASYLAGRHPEADELLLQADMAVRQGAIRGRLEATPADARARASLARTLAENEPAAQLTALALSGFMDDDGRAVLIASHLRHPEARVVQAAVRAAGTRPTAHLAGHLIGLLPDKAVRLPAIAGLVQLGAAALPLVQEALRHETDERVLGALTDVCARLGTAAARQLLLTAARSANLAARAAALRALGSFATVAADATLFRQLVEDELRLAQCLLHGMVPAGAEWRAALRYELHLSLQRLLGLLLQLYDRQPVIDARRGVAHSAPERQTNALEILGNLIPQPLYRGLQALLDASRLRDKVQVFDSLLGPPAPAEVLPALVVRSGETAFSAWTIGLALGQWHPQPATVALLYPHLLSASPLVHESAALLLRRLPELRPAAYDYFLALHPALNPSLMATSYPVPGLSAYARVRLLKGTALFAETPENVLAAIVPIMQEVAFGAGQEIFSKGALGTSLFIISEGTVDILQGKQQLACFGPGDFFGELALLDAAPRSATAVACSAVVTFRLDQEDFYEVMEERTEVLRSIMRVLCQRLRHQNEQTLTAH